LDIYGIAQYTYYSSINIISQLQYIFYSASSLAVRPGIIVIIVI